MEALLRFDNVSKQYPNGVHALNGVSFTVGEGEFISVIGPSGSGKSTLLRAINRLIPISGGTVLLEGEAVSRQRGRALRALRRKVGMIFQNYNLVYSLSVLQNVLHGRLGYMRGLKGIFGLYSEADKRQALELLEELGLGEFSYNRASDLSGGQKQRVAIAGVMAMKPQCIILDEPTAMLDPNGRREVIRTVRQLNESQGVTVLLITHYMEEATWADRIIVMDDGKIVMDGKPREIFSRVRELKECGLDVPQATELAFELKEAGMPLPDGILSREELAEELERILEPSARTQGSGKETGEKDVH